MKAKKKIKRKGECNTCWGYGLWAVGDPCPMGRMDSRDGSPSKKCPECGHISVIKSLTQEWQYCICNHSQKVEVEISCGYRRRIKK